MVYTDSYYEMANWYRMLSLVDNRVSIVNQLLGCRYDHARDNPCSLVYARGWYRLMWRGGVVSCFRVFSDELRGTLGWLDFLVSSLWRGDSMC